MEVKWRRAFKWPFSRLNPLIGLQPLIHPHTSLSPHSNTFNISFKPSIYILHLSPITLTPLEIFHYSNLIMTLLDKFFRPWDPSSLPSDEDSSLLSITSCSPNQEIKNVSSIRESSTQKLKINNLSSNVTQEANNNSTQIAHSKVLSNPSKSKNLNEAEINKANKEIPKACVSNEFKYEMNKGIKNSHSEDPKFHKAPKRKVERLNLEKISSTCPEERRSKESRGELAERLSFDHQVASTTGNRLFYEPMTPSSASSISSASTASPFYEKEGVFNFYRYPSVAELAALSRHELTAMGLLPPEKSNGGKSKRQRPKRYQCPHCQVAFSNNGQLLGHIRIHTGERPFVCEEEGCGKSFTRNEELTRHRRIHSGVRPYPCGYCGKKFGRKDHLKKHSRTHQRSVFSDVLHHPFAPFLFTPPPNPTQNAFPFHLL